MMDRREFFKALCALSGTLVLPTGCGQDGTGTALESGTGIGTNAPLAFSKQVFVGTIDTVFSVSHDIYGVIDLQLNLVTDEIYIPEAEQFTISLNGPMTPLLDEDSYAVYNDNLGNIDLYIQPGAVVNGQQQYIAVFSLLNT